MRKFRPTISVYLCKWCPTVAVSQYEKIKSSSGTNANVKIFRFPCSSAIDPVEIALGFYEGVDGMLWVTCPEGNCHYFTGNQKAKVRFEFFQELFTSLGHEPERLRLISLEHDNPYHFFKALSELCDEVRNLGPFQVRDA